MSVKIDATRCKEWVNTGDSWSSGHQCRFKVWEDGYCRQHHPDTVSERRRKSNEKRAQEWANSPHVKLGTAEARVKELEAENERLREALTWYAEHTPTIGKRAKEALALTAPKEATDE